jgi:uncharacterized protein
MKLVLDTNVLIAALITKGVCAELLEHCVLRHRLVSSDQILAEVRKHLLGKFKFSEAEAEEATDLLRSQTALVLPDPLDAPVCRDPDDDLILATAIAGEARCVITGDKDLLVIGRFRDIEILRPSEFPNFEMDNPDA